MLALIRKLEAIENKSAPARTLIGTLDAVEGYYLRRYAPPIEPRCISAGERLMSVPGIGPIISSAMVAAIGAGEAFSKGRDFAAWLGLVPKQISTGELSLEKYQNAVTATCAFYSSKQRGWC